LPEGKNTGGASKLSGAAKKNLVNNDIFRAGEPVERLDTGNEAVIPAAVFRIDFY